MIPNVLITDDDAAFRGVLCEALQHPGLELIQAGNGEEALQLIDSRAIHMVILDVHMPKVTGLDVIRTLDQRPDRMPYVLMSARMDETIEREAALRRAYKVLRKPIRLRQIREIVCGGLAELYGWHPPV